MMVSKTYSGLHARNLINDLLMTPGTQETDPRLGYICEVRPLTTNADADNDLCHIPFKYNGDTFYSCAQPDVDPVNIGEPEGNF